MAKPSSSKQKPVARTLTFKAPPGAGKTAMQVHLSESGHLIVLDKAGKRRPELEVPWPTLWAAHVQAQGHDPAGYTFHLPGGRTVKIVRQIDGLTWKIGA